MNRRHFLKVVSVFTAGVAAFSSPIKLFAAWNKEAFVSEKMDEAMKKLFGTNEHTASDAVKLKAADIAENGAVVPVSVSTDLKNVDYVAVFAEDNPSPLAVGFELSDSIIANVSTRIKLGKTSHVYAVVRSDGKLYSANKEVKVTIGGCGG